MKLKQIQLITSKNTPSSSDDYVKYLGADIIEDTPIPVPKDRRIVKKLEMQLLPLLTN